MEQNVSDSPGTTPVQPEKSLDLGLDGHFLARFDALVKEKIAAIHSDQTRAVVWDAWLDGDTDLVFGVANGVPIVTARIGLARDFHFCLTVEVMSLVSPEEIGPVQFVT